MIEPVSYKPAILVQRFTFCCYTGSIKKAAAISKPISLKDFPAHVAEMHKEDDHGFETEFTVCMNTLRYKIYSQQIVIIGTVSFLEYQFKSYWPSEDR